MNRLFFGLLVALSCTFVACSEGRDEPVKPEMERVLAAALRIPSEEVGVEENVFILSFIDGDHNVELGVVLTGAINETLLKAGDYSSVAGGLSAEDCTLVVKNAALAIEGFAKGAATVGVDGDSYTFDIELTDHNNRLYRFTYEGVVVDMDSVAAAYDINFVATYMSGSYYTPEFNGISAHNYYFVLSDKVAKVDLQEPNSTYFYFDLYSNTLNSHNTIPNGIYVYDVTDGANVGTLSSYYTYGVTTDAEGNPTWIIYTEGKVTVTNGMIEARFTLEDGRTARITYMGDLSLPTFGDGTDGEETLSTLTEDVSLNETGYTCSFEYFGDCYTPDTDNWWVAIYENGQSLDGKYIQLDLVADYAADNWDLLYKPHREGADFKNCYITGYLEDGFITGCWYAELVEGAISGAMAPIVGGDIRVVTNGDGTKSFTFDNCVDDAGYKITGSVTCQPMNTTSAVNVQPRGVHELKRSLAIH